MNNPIINIEERISYKPIRLYKNNGKHDWKLDENGEVDYNAWSNKSCNGVICTKCGAKYCVHCESDFIKLSGCETDKYKCGNCRSSIDSSDKFCSKCGTPVNWNS